MENTARIIFASCCPGLVALRKHLVASCCMMVVSWLGFVGTAATSRAQDIKIWEFSPYEVGIKYSFDANVNLSAGAKNLFLQQLDAELERTFQATWSLHFSELSPTLANVVARDLDGFTVSDFTSNDLVLVVSQQHEASKTLRTYEAAIEGLPAVAISASDLSALQASSSRFELSIADPERTESSITTSLLDKCVIEPGGLAAIQQKLLAHEIPGALIPRSTLAAVAVEVRPLITMLPWQSESLFRRYDKLFFVTVSLLGDEYQFRVREMDCPMQFLGPVFEAATSNWSHASRMATDTLIRSFAPIARVEEAEATTASLRMRAGGLIVDPNNPALIRVGDVLQPVIRRDDRNGVPALLAPLSWTFAAVSQSDGIKMDANVYSYSGGPGLQGRKNRRTQRVLLRVRPLYPQTDIKIAVLGTEGKPQSGCFVYRRDLLTEQFEFLGRTDWRGRFTISVPSNMGGFLPEAIRMEREKAQKQASKITLLSTDSAPTSTEEQTTNSADTDEVQVVEPKEQAEHTVASEASTPEVDDPNSSADIVPLNFPLTRIYIKSGDSVLAMLPMVPGLSQIEIAELPDDSRRLEAEAFVRGFQEKSLDLIGLRNLHAARVGLYLKENRMEEAQAALEDLRRLSNYNELADELERIQRVMLEETSGAISIRIKSKIDRMFQTTRDMLQKYLQDNLLQESERAVKTALKSPVNSP